VLIDQNRLQVLNGLCVPEGTAVLVLPHEECQQLTGFDFHQGILACGERPPGIGLQDVVSSHGEVTIVVAPQMTNPDNLGTLLRLSAAFGINAVVLGRGSADPFSRRALRVSMGAALAIPVVEGGTPMEIVGELRDLDVATVATVLGPDAVPLKDAVRPGRVAIFFGNEAHGLSLDVVAASDNRVTIPMSNSVDSLNVSAAAAIVLYHFTRVADTSVSFPAVPSDADRELA
jgi:tRNA G18 (ribose-2'-O)-methylase SpoU